MIVCIHCIHMKFTERFFVFWSLYRLCGLSSNPGMPAAQIVKDRLKSHELTKAVLPINAITSCDSPQLTYFC